MPTAAPVAPLAVSPAKIRYITCDANEAVASVAYRLSEFIAIYPITPSSPMAESCDEWASVNKPNLWGEVPRVVQLQSEGGVAGAVHGGLLGGTLTTTFTASQGLLLMLPNLYKIAGELLPLALHVTARALAAQGLSIFGDQSDVMACRPTGCALLCSNNPQESQDCALVAHAAALRARVPIIHFFDGFRTSHEISKIVPLSDDTLRALIDPVALAAFRSRALTPDHPRIQGTAQNPDVYFQGRETVNPYIEALPDIVEDCFAKLAKATGRKYSLVEYHGHPQAEHVVVAMGSGVEALQSAAEHLNANGGRVGVIAIRLFQPFPVSAFLRALPASVRTLGVLDRTKEPGAPGEPLYLSVLAALAQSDSPVAVPLRRVVGGRYGLGSKEFTPAMALGVFAHLNTARPRHNFTIGIYDDVSHTSLPWDNELELEAPGVRRCVFVGLGADGTVGANKNSIKIIGEQTDFFAQGYFVYDSKKSGSVTVSHLRFGPQPIHAPWLVRSAQFVACSQFSFVGRHEILGYAAPGATVLLDSPHDAATTWAKLPRAWQETLFAKKIRLYIIDANGVANAAGMGRRTNTILQTCFFALSGVLPQAEAIAHIKKAITKTYARKGDHVVKMNHAAVDAALASLIEVPVPATLAAAPAGEVATDRYAAFTEGFFRDVTARLLAGEGDLLPVSAIPPDGGWPTATTQLEKRSIALEIPQWDASLCIQCNKCVFVCPHAAIRATHQEPASLADAPASVTTVPFRSNEQPGRRYLLQVAPDDCTGCSLCVQVCPAKDKTNPRHKALDLVPAAPRFEVERANWSYFTSLPVPDRTRTDFNTVKGTQFAQPLFEFSGACAGCGETPYIKLLTQLVGDRLTIANATGCSSIYGGNLPTTPYAKDANQRGPAWANSLFEDNAEFGLGMRCAADQRHASAVHLLKTLAPKLDTELVHNLINGGQATEGDLVVQRARIAQLQGVLDTLPPSDEVSRLRGLADDLVKKSLWIIGGDGWAYDIGYGGLDHVLASGANVKVLVLDTEVYSNTGGQASKSTPMGAVAKFTSGGKPTGKKDLALMAMQYGHIYVARVAFGAKDSQTLQAFREAEAYDGPALIIAYSHCIAHGYNLSQGLEQQKLAVDTGYWPLFRFDPRRAEQGTPALHLDSPAPKLDLVKFTANETRFAMLKGIAPQRFEDLGLRAQTLLKSRYALYQHLADNGPVAPPAAAPTVTPPPPTPAQI
ncbi:pyruvate-flavodoxin oxidoreductase [Verrucomicrobia bacterium IMCC26134]|nr:pyruvate-flavodoxin oxidoreductase [Verrucomicrobia bacterium IMCC26134]